LLESNQESRATSDNLSQDLTPGSANKDEGCADPVDVGVKEPEDDTGKTDQVSNSPGKSLKAENSQEFIVISELILIVMI